MNKILLLLFCLFIISCESEKDVNIVYANTVQKHIIYIKDCRVDICYAIIPMLHSYNMTSVPCEDVEELLVKTESCKE